MIQAITGSHGGGRDFKDTVNCSVDKSDAITLIENQDTVRQVLQKVRKVASVALCAFNGLLQRRPHVVEAVGKGSQFILARQLDFQTKLIINHAARQRFEVDHAVDDLALYIPAKQDHHE